MACISMAGGHKCIERSIDCDCPICGDYMFSSPRPVVFMQCGHSIHRHCFNEHMNSSYKCPICNKSCINMEYQFRNYDIAILTQPMPPEYRDARAIISCNDCSAKSQTAYHWLGLKCTVCNSYNTIQHQLLNMPGGVGGAAHNSAALTGSTAAISQVEQSQRNMAADAARILREMRRTQTAESSPGVLTRNGSEVSFITARQHQPQNAPTAAANNRSLQPAADVTPISASAPATSSARSFLATALAAIPDPGIAALLRRQEEEQGEEEALEIWGSDAEYLRRNFTSADEDDDDNNDDDDEYDDDSSEDEGVDTDEEDDEDDPNEIVLLGHR